ncbi:MAG TPA: nuclease A inhibitor family protein [Chitinophaga sp.]|uniref:nuclease A inhibitor family protein n=1 Tax=Chitinophaga sp. TaxID=1869181 RepID=UPI002CE5BAAC|nr:nuclease A inhibitor family protein [Chitinophaga sp.]HVI48770.1 nuclease A inhibitor family protein [Chitinophaga sp.]
MEKTAFLEKLTDKIAGILYFSESEYPLTIEQWGILPAATLPEKIATLNVVEQNVLRPVNADDFFNEIERTADPNDKPIVENAQKFKTLYQFLKENLSNIQVTRVETGASIPVYITGFLPDGSCIALQTTSIES